MMYMRKTDTILVILGALVLLYLQYNKGQLLSCTLTSLPASETWQSSTYEGTFIQQLIAMLMGYQSPFSANNGVNGKSVSGAISGACAQTKSEVSPWWQAKLDDNYYMTAVEIIAPETCDTCPEDFKLENILVEIGEVSLDYTSEGWIEDWNAGKQNCSFFSTAVDALRVVVNCSKPLFGNFVRLTKLSIEETTLSLCEVDIIGYRNCTINPSVSSKFDPTSSADIGYLTSSGKVLNTSHVAPSTSATIRPSNSSAFLTSFTTGDSSVSQNFVSLVSSNSEYSTLSSENFHLLRSIRLLTAVSVSGVISSPVVEKMSSTFSSNQLPHTYNLLSKSADIVTSTLQPSFSEVRSVGLGTSSQSFISSHILTSDFPTSAEYLQTLTTLSDYVEDTLGSPRKAVSSTSAAQISASSSSTVLTSSLFQELGSQLQLSSSKQSSTFSIPAQSSISSMISVPTLSSISLTVYVHSMSSTSSIVSVPTLSSISSTKVSVPTLSSVSSTVSVPSLSSTSSMISVPTMSSIYSTIFMPTLSSISETVSSPTQSSLSSTVYMPSLSSISSTVFMPTLTLISSTVSKPIPSSISSKITVLLLSSVPTMDYKQTLSSVSTTGSVPKLSSIHSTSFISVTGHMPKQSSIFSTVSMPSLSSISSTVSMPTTYSIYSTVSIPTQTSLSVRFPSSDYTTSSTDLYPSFLETAGSFAFKTLTSTPALALWISSRFSMSPTSHYTSTMSVPETISILGQPATSTTEVFSTVQKTSKLVTKTSFLSKSTMLSAHVSSTALISSSSVTVSQQSSVIPVWCPCTCEQAELISSLTSNNKTTEQVTEEIEEALTELTVDSKKTTVNERKLVSVDDKRGSAKLVGTIGVVFCATILVLIILSDLPMMIVGIKRVIGR